MTLLQRVSRIEEFCPECGGVIIHDDFRGENACQNCGLIVSERRIDIGYKRNQYSYEEYKAKSRTGSPNTKLDFNIAYKTVIDNDTPESNNRQFRRLIKIDNSNSDNDRTYITAAIEIKRLAKKLHLPQFIREDAFLLYKKAKERELIMGRSIGGIVAACLYYCCRKAHYPIFLHEITELSIYDHQKISYYLRVLVKDLTLSHIPINYKYYVSKVISKVECGINEEKKLRNVLDLLPNSFFMGKNPKVVFAAIIYFISRRDDLGLSQKFLANNFNITTTSIRNNFREINKLLNS